MERRQAMMDTAKAALVAAKTLAKEKVYIDRTRTIEPERSDDPPPMICIYMQEMKFERTGGASQAWVETDSLFLECWAEVSPGRAQRALGKADELQSKALNAIAQQAVNAILNDDAMSKLSAERPQIFPHFGIDRNSQFSVGCAVIEFRYTTKGAVPTTESPEYPDLERIWADHELKDSPGTTPPDQGGLSTHPDLSQNLPNLQE